MARRGPEPDEGSQVEPDPRELRRRQRNRARAVAILVIAALTITFVVQNRQNVALHLWFVTGHVRVVWLVVVCLAVGALVEALVRRGLRTRFRGRGKSET